MIKYSCTDFFSLKNTTTPPAFIVSIQYVTYDIDDDTVTNVIENNKKIIQQNIMYKQSSKKNHKNHKFKKYQKTYKSPFIKQFSPKTNEIVVVLNKLTNDTFEKSIKHILFILNDYPIDLIETELCQCFYNRIIYEYTYSEMYVNVIKQIKNNLSIGNQIISLLQDVLFGHFSRFCEMFEDLSEKDNFTEIYTIERKKFTGLILFVSHLFNHNIIDISVFTKKLQEHPCLTYIEMLCKIMCISGRNIKSRNSIVNHLLSLRKNLSTSSRYYYEIENVLDMKKQNWNGTITSLTNITDQQQHSIKQSNCNPDTLVSQYKNNSIDVSNIPDNVLEQFLDKILDQVLEKSDKHILNLCKFCNTHINNNLTFNAISNIKQFIDDLRIDIPNIEDKIHLFETNISFVH